ncbi:TNT domain-containing protein [Actinocrispum wychmicini]|uniref:Uncharacterized protein DUF4237 n=1 Tax=Actinocrispum wychmicini TaxID=1213861 RepID=A0A4R2K6Q4_9PSEU|nr:TNT domain-containing protein [Actinocrispum wychmicini]TCO65609.1 uncharacterized protein DUF4237 [Actinocrispum wychmicini]
MGIELPPELAEVAARTGVKWPAADEDRMRAAAQVWRDTGTRLTTLTKDADTSAQSALRTTEGAGADAARTHWNGYVKPDTGHLTAVAQGCTTAADHLDHAAEQVGAAKLAIVRNLVPLANHKDVAEHAAAAGHPTALLGLDTAVKGTAANVANVHHTLMSAVQPATGAVVDTTHTLVDPSPGAHGPLKMVEGVAGGAHHLVHDTGKAVQAAAGPDAGQVVQNTGNTVQTLAGSANQMVQGVAGPGNHGHHGILDTATGTVQGGLDSHAGGQAAGAHGGPDPLAGGHGASNPHGGPPGLLGSATGSVGDAVDSVVGGHGTPASHGGPVFDHGGPEPSTGPIPMQPGHVLPHDLPTPPTGVPIVPDHTVHAAAATPAVLDVPPAASGPVAAPGPVAGAPTGGGGGPQFVTNSPAPTAPPGSSAPVGGPTAAPPAGPAPGPRAQAPVVGGPVPTAVRGEAPGPAVMPVDQGRQQAPAATPVPAHMASAKPDQDTVLAIWLVRMFPIGHMPVATGRPARQLPPPSPEYDYAPGMRFEPHDHPESDLISDTETFPTELPSPPLEDPVVDGLAVGYDSLGGQNERDWDRRFVVRPGAGRATVDTEYAWPPSELFPEGATAPGEPEVLDPGTVIDRFGIPDGRVFAADSTAFDRRALPPSHLRAGYRRYQVLRPLPVWRGISAAWFAQPGGGVRYRTVYPAQDLVALGYLTEEFTDES